MGTSNWRCIDVYLKEKRPCKCGKGFVYNYCRVWENVLTGENRETAFFEHDCPDECYRENYTDI